MSINRGKFRQALDAAEAAFAEIAAKFRGGKSIDKEEKAMEDCKNHIADLVKHAVLLAEHSETELLSEHIFPAIEDDEPVHDGHIDPPEPLKPVVVEPEVPASPVSPASQSGTSEPQIPPTEEKPPAQ